MQRARFQPLMAAGLVALAAASVTAARAAEKRPPNVVIFLSDDVGYAEYGFQGSKDIPTPNIDSIAKNGVRFTQGYVSGPYCSPTRAGLMTGRYQTRFGHEFNGGGNAGGNEFGLPVTETTIANRMKSLGYATCAIGKWHLGGAPKFLPMARGFDEFYGTVANTPYYKPPQFIDSRVSPNAGPVTDDNFYTTDAYADRAVDWIGKQKDRPFFLYLPFNAQHAPLQAPQKYLDRFAGITDEKRRAFAAVMSAKDDAVGRVLKKVKELGQEENTLFIFFSDNGGPTPQTTSNNAPLRGVKATTLEGGVRVPFCLQWKGKIRAGKTYDHPVIQLDLLPTCVRAAGGQVDPAWKLDGVDLVPYLTGLKNGKPHDALYWRFGPQWAIRKGDWKLVAARPDNNQPRLVNLKNDIAEEKDLSASEPAKLKELKDDWDAWNSQQIAPLWNQPPAAARGRRNRMNQQPKKQ